MAALTDRQKARENLSQVFQTILDNMIPPDTNVPLEGSKFIDWEDQGDDAAWAGGFEKEAVPVQGMRPVFSPLKSGTGACRSRPICRPRRRRREWLVRRRRIHLRMVPGR